MEWFEGTGVMDQSLIKDGPALRTRDRGQDSPSKVRGFTPLVLFSNCTVKPVSLSSTCRFGYVLRSTYGGGWDA